MGTYSAKSQTRLEQLCAFVRPDLVKVKDKSAEGFLVALPPNERFLPQLSLVLPGLLPRRLLLLLLLAFVS